MVVRTPDADRAAALLDGRVERRDGDRLVVVEADPTVVNARLVTAGLRVSEIAPERRSLEELMLSVTGSGSDRIDPAGQGRPDEGRGEPGRGEGDPGGGEGEPGGGEGDLGGGQGDPGGEGRAGRGRERAGRGRDPRGKR